MPAALGVLLLLKELFLLHPAVLPYYIILTTDIVQMRSAVLAPVGGGTTTEIDRTRNAIWLDHRWLQEGVKPAEIVSLCRVLKAHQIRYVYPHLSPLREDGRLPAFSTEAARQFREIMRRQCPDVLVLPWIGGVQSGFRQMREGTVRLDSDVYLQSVAGECVLLTTQLGFDGIHLNIEPVQSGDRRLVRWLEFLKQKLGASKMLSIAAAKPSLLEGFNFSPLRSWDNSYFQEVAAHADQIVLMAYDTSLSPSFFYSLFIYEKVSGLLETLHRHGMSAKILLGVPTYDRTAHHDPQAECIAAAAEGLFAALGRSDLPHQNFEGLALYAYWTTDEEEWSQFRSHWLDQK